MFRKSYTIAIHPANNIRKINLCSKMKIRTLFLFCVLFCANITFAQWQHIATIGNYELRAVKFFNEHTGIVAGEGGIWRSTNSGVNWTNVLSGQNFNAISFPDNNIGYAVGDSGKIYKTINTGVNWNQQTSNISENLHSVSFFNLTTGYAVGQNGKILRTQTGGTNWYQNYNPILEDLNCVQMIFNSQTALIVGTTANIERFGSTANGGTNWLYSFSSSGASLKSVFAVNTTNIFAVGTIGRVRKSTNSGASWTLININTSATLNCVYFTDVNTGYIFGNIGTIFKTTNAGNNWLLQSVNFSNNLFANSFINTTTGWIVGSNGLIARIGIPVGNIQISNNNTPKQSMIYPNYPNPFNPETKIRFDIGVEGDVKISIYDITGLFLQNIVNDYFNVGKYDLDFDGQNFSSGIYICKIQTADITEFIKLVIIK